MSTQRYEYASALSQHPLPAHATGEVAGHLLDQLGGASPDLLVLFTTSPLVGAIEDVARTLRELLEPRVLVGATAVAVAGVGREVEDGFALSAFAARLGDAMLTPVALETARTADGTAVTGWPEDAAAGAHTLFLLGDPFSFPAEGFLASVAAALPDLQVIGGMASAAHGPGGNRLVLDARITDTGAVGVLMARGPRVRAVVSQGCRPVGRPYVVTDAVGSLVRSLAGEPPLARLRDVAATAPDEERELLGRGLHLGVVVDEHRAEFGRGDFLVRNVLGADRETGAIAVGDELSVGQTVQFHVRDAAAADEDLRALLAGTRADAALLFTCNGRGKRLFGTPDHDAATVAEALGPVPLAGAFCAGELGPVGGRSFLHGFTASLALFGS